MSDFQSVYATFQARFRGSRELIRERLGAYTPLLTDLERRSGSPRSAIDFGCGRGEWIQLLSERGWDALGVDSNDSMLQEATALGLRVERGDLVDHIGKVSTESISLVSAFHVVEHVSHETLTAFIAESMRTLVPGGLLILETPNPENLAVGASNFYVDPTHLRPIPPSLLTFYVEQAGFGTSHIVRLNGEPGQTGAASLEQVVRPMFTRAPDYAVVAVKGNDTEGMSALAASVQQIGQRPPVDFDALHAFSEELRTSLQRIEEDIVRLSKETKPLRAAAAVGRRVRAALAHIVRRNQR